MITKLTEESKEMLKRWGRNEHMGAWVRSSWSADKYYIRGDANLVPCYCLVCQEQMEGFFYYDGGRYGQVGTVTCEKCGSEMCVTDNDMGLDHLYISLGSYRNPFLKGVEKYGTEIPMIELDVSEIYKLNPETFTIVKEKTGFDMFKKRKSYSVEEVVEEICKRIGIKEEEIPSEPIAANDQITRVPNVINKWFHLLKILESSDFTIIPQEPTREEKMEAELEEFIQENKINGFEMKSFEDVDNYLPIFQKFIESLGIEGKLWGCRDEFNNHWMSGLILEKSDSYANVHPPYYHNEHHIGCFIDDLIRIMDEDGKRWSPFGVFHEKLERVSEWNYIEKR